MVRIHVMEVLLVSAPYHPHTFLSFDRAKQTLGKRAGAPPLAVLTVAAPLAEEWDLRLVHMAAQEIRKSLTIGASPYNLGEFK
jgi:hypothetical protein